MKSYFYESLMTEEGRSNCMVYPDPKFLIFKTKNGLIYFSEDGGWFFWSYVITQGICNKFIEMKISVGGMVWPWLCLFQHWTFVKYWWDVVFAFVYALCIISLWVLLINEMKSLSGTVEKWQIWLCIQIKVISTEDGRSTSIFLLYWQTSQGRMADQSTEMRFASLLSGGFITV